MDSDYGFDDFLFNAGAGEFNQILAADESLGAGAEEFNPFLAADESSGAGAGDFDLNDWFGDTNELPAEQFNALLADIDPASSASYAPDASFASSMPALDTSYAADASFAPGIPALDASYAADTSFIPGIPALDASYAPAPPQADSGPLDDEAVIALGIKACGLLVSEPMTAANYVPQAHVFANLPDSTFNSSPLYSRLTSTRFRNSAGAKAHRNHARIPAKSQANDITRVKSFGRDYWVCRIYNAMIDSQHIFDGEFSTNRTRFTKIKVFDEVDLEARAHHVFDKAIAVHERGWTRSRVYHKNTVRGKLVDKDKKSVEMRLSRICLVLQHTKSAVDDVMRGGVTLALLCDNPWARWYTKHNNDIGNRKRGERLKETSTKRTQETKAQKIAQEEEAEDDSEEEAEEDSEVEAEVEPEVEAEVEPEVEPEVEAEVEGDDMWALLERAIRE